MKGKVQPARGWADSYASWEAAWSASKVPEGASGAWTVDRFIAQEGPRAWECSLYGRDVEIGATYTRLMRRGANSLRDVVVMSDTPAEFSDHTALFAAVRRLGARNVLIHGLGLGCALRAVLAEPTVQRVDVVEMSKDVVKLVGPTFKGDTRVHIHLGDCMVHKFPSTRRWDVAWHDIWDTISDDNLPAMKRLKLRYARKVTWQGCWAQEMARRMR